MSVDEALLEAAAADGQCMLRFYQWNEPTLSLGYFQTYADRWGHPASSRAPVVRRASGGGAILHDLELTYSIAVPMTHPLAIDRLGLYHAIHSALVETLSSHWGIEATIHKDPPTNERPSIRHSVAPQPFLCFQRRSSGDVLLGGVKIAGSAQRRCQGAVLQHGSVLLARSEAAPELCGIAELVDKKIGPEDLIEAWLEPLARRLSLRWTVGQLSRNQQGRADALVVEKYAASTWNESRGRV